MSHRDFNNFGSKETKVYNNLLSLSRPDLYCAEFLREDSTGKFSDRSNNQVKLCLGSWSQIDTEEYNNYDYENKHSYAMKELH